MTEQDWFASVNPVRLFNHLTRTGSGTWKNKSLISDRKCNLFVLACIGLQHKPDAKYRLAWQEWTTLISRNRYQLSSKEGASYWLGLKVGQISSMKILKEEEKLQLCFLRDLVGNPFQDLSKIDYSWFSKDVKSLALAIYDNIEDFVLDPQRLLVLADALEEAGCTDMSMLRHLRGFSICPSCTGTGRDNYGDRCNVCFHKDWPLGWQPYPALTHVEGCWVVDLCLGLQ